MPDVIMIEKLRILRNAAALDSREAPDRFAAKASMYEAAIYRRLLIGMGAVA